MTPKKPTIELPTNPLVVDGHGRVVASTFARPGVSVAQREAEHKAFIEQSGRKIKSRRVTAPIPNPDKAVARLMRRRPLTLRMAHLQSPEKPIKAMHLPDAHGNAGCGKLGVIGTCTRCGRRNKVIGPISSKPERRTCVPTCEKAKGQHPILDKLRALPRERVG